MFFFFFFFFKLKTAYEIVPCDWSSDVCSSDLDVAGVVEAQLRPQQPLGARLRRREDELDVPAPARLEHQLGADRSLEALEARRTVAEPQELRDRARVIGARRIDGGRREELHAPADQLLSEGREHPLAPVARGHERYAAPMLILENE